MRGGDLDIYRMNVQGADEQILYDSGSHDADVDWMGDKIVFTTGSRIWLMQSDGTHAVQVTNPPRAGEWGNANLPFGDYDPRFSPDGSKIVFERLEDDQSPHGNYNIHIVNSDGSGERRLTDTGYSQGLASWSQAGDKIIYLVSAVDGVGQYDIYVSNADGTANHNVTPDYFPADFLCHAAVFTGGDSKILFIGQWWE
jgi:Tol biopolymer transport system component